MEQARAHEATEIAGEAIEVVSIWNGTVLGVTHLPAERDDPEAFPVGEEPGCRFPLPAELLGGATKVSLVSLYRGGTAITVVPGATGDVTFEDGRRATFADLAGAGAARASDEVPGGLALDLPRRGRSKLDLGPFTFLVSSVAAPRLALARAGVDWRSHTYAGLSALLHAAFLALLVFVPPDPQGLSLDPLDGSNRFMKYMIAPPETRVETVPDMLAKKEKPADAPDSGKAHAGPEGQMGDRNAPRRDTAYMIKGSPDNTRIRMARDTLKDMAAHAGILSYLSAANAPTSPFGADSALGVDPENALGHLVGDGFGDAFGYGGLGIRDTGRGGGGDGSDTIGVGDLNTISNWRGPRKGHGPGDGPGPALGPRTGDKGPRVKGSGGKVLGTIPKDAIRRVVQRHMNEMKFCYERALAKRPDLEGRIAVKFVITGSGSVQSAAVESSSVANAAMEQCVTGAVMRWTFPRPADGGIVIVSYPFAFTSSNN